MPRFFFLIAAKRLAGLVKNEVDLGLYKPFKVDNTVKFSQLKFADDTILGGENSWETPPIMKILLRVLLNYPWKSS